MFCLHLISYTFYLEYLTFIIYLHKNIIFMHTAVYFQSSCGYLNVKTLQLGPEKKSKVLIMFLFVIVVFSLSQQALLCVFFRTAIGIVTGHKSQMID